MRLLHTMLRVGNLDRSIEFYTNVLGMQLLRRKDYPDGKFTLAFVGYGAEAEHSVIELTHNWDTPRYDLGNGFGHIALEVDDVYKATDEIRRRGGKIIRDAWVFGLIDESETCEGWMPQGIEDLWRKVNQEWEKYGFRVNHLPDDMRERFMRIQTEALKNAKAAGWSPGMEADD